MPIFVSSLGSSAGASLSHFFVIGFFETIKDEKICLARQRLNRAWEVNQMTDTVVLAIAAELDKLCNEYERLMKSYLNKSRK